MSHLKSSYERVVGHMSSRYPHVFDLEDEENYGFDRYLFALLTIQVRSVMLGVEVGLTAAHSAGAVSVSCPHGAS